MQLLSRLHEGLAPDEAGGEGVRAQMRRLSHVGPIETVAIPVQPLDAAGHVHSFTIDDIEAGMHPDRRTSANGGRGSAAARNISRQGRLQQRRRSSWDHIRDVAIGAVSSVEATSRIPLLMQWGAHGDTIHAIQVCLPEFLFCCSSLPLIVGAALSANYRSSSSTLHTRC